MHKSNFSEIQKSEVREIQTIEYDVNHKFCTVNCGTCVATYPNITGDIFKIKVTTRSIDNIGNFLVHIKNCYNPM